ncbi:hypothetical protein [Megalodesulfovibrio paquesii]
MELHTFTYGHSAAGHSKWCCRVVERADTIKQGMLCHKQAIKRKRHRRMTRGKAVFEAPEWTG